MKKKSLMRSFLAHLGAFAVIVATTSLFFNCWFFFNQPKVPKELMKQINK